MITLESRRIDDLIAITSRLSDLMHRETTMLGEMRGGEIASLQEEKHTLAVAYEREMKRLDEHPEEFATVEPEKQAKLLEQVGVFKEVAVKNERVLHAARETNQRLLQAIVEAVTEQRARHGYSATGAAENAAASDSAAGLSLSLDQQL
jgi:flagellar biosynthesis/type III secretory pathway chaperone